jgi:hypothetical protein
LSDDASVEVASVDPVELVVSSLLEPHAAIPSANDVAMAAAKKRRGRTDVIGLPLSRFRAALPAAG